jgi:putative protease
MLKAPELLLPAGTLDKMRAAYDFGADAVYAGQPRYSLRARNNDFKLEEELKTGIDEAHARGKLFLWPAICCRTTARSRPIWPTWSR